MTLKKLHLLKVYFSQEQPKTQRDPSILPHFAKENQEVCILSIHTKGCYFTKMYINLIIFVYFEQYGPKF